MKYASLLERPRVFRGPAMPICRTMPYLSSSLIVLCLVVIASVSPVLAQSPDSVSTRAVVTVPSLIMRNAPQAGAPAVGAVRQDEAFPVLAQQDGWVQIEVRGSQAWVWGQYVRINGKVAASSEDIARMERNPAVAANKAAPAGQPGFEDFSLDLQWEARGLIKALNRVTISSEIVGKVSRLPFREGNYFRKGQTLVGFDCSLLEAEHSKAQASYKGIQAKVENDHRLAKLNSIGAIEVALDEAEMEQRKAELRIADIARRRCIISAPYNGRVVRLDVREHQSVSAQQELMEIVGASLLEVEAIVPSAWFEWLATGQPIKLKIDETGKAYTGTVKAVGAVVDPVSKTIPVRARLRNVDRDLIPGMSASIYFRGPQ